MDQLQPMLDQMTTLIGGYLPNILGAIAILVVGWIVARILSAGVRKMLRKTAIDEKLASLMTNESSSIANAGDWIARGVFYVLMMFVLVGFFQVLELPLITEPINNLLNQLFAYAPQVLGAGLLAVAAWVVATLVRIVVTKSLTAAKLDERVNTQTDDTPKLALTQSIGDGLYYLIFLFFLPAILTALKLEGLLQPIQTMLDKMLGFLPNVVTAGVILLVGFFVSKIVRGIVTNLLAAVGTDRISQRVGLTNMLGEQALSSVLGLVVYVFMLIPIIISALNALQLDAITLPASNMLTMILEAIPTIFAAALIMGITYVVGKLVAGLITNLLSSVGFDNMLTRVGLLRENAETEHTPSAIVGYIIMFTIMLFATTEAFSMLGFDMMSELVAQFTVFGSHILLGMVIFAIGLYLSNLVSGAIMNSGSAQASTLALAARVSVLFLAGAMALRHMGIANEIINLAFGLLLGAIAVAAAIAFGYGGRDLAAKKLAEWTREN